MPRKTDQLQIRVSPAQKLAIQRLAARSKLDVSAWVLKTLLPEQSHRFEAILRSNVDPQFMFAELGDYLSSLPAQAFSDAIVNLPKHELTAVDENYLAALVEFLAAKNHVSPPEWVTQIRPLAEPWFASDLISLRLHLLTNSPAPFRRRNLFVDSTVGDRV